MVLLGFTTAYYANKKIVKSTMLTTRTELSIYKPMRKPILLYAAKTNIQGQFDKEMIF